MAGRTRLRWLFWAAACCAALHTAAVRAEEPVRLDTRVPENVQEIRLAADDIVEHVERDSRYFRLLGSVLIDQGGITRLRAKSAIVRVLVEQFKDGDVIFADVYLEGDARAEHTSGPRQGHRAIVYMSSKKPPVVAIGEAVKQPLRGDPLFHRALDAWTPRAVIQAGAQDGTPGAPPPPLDLPGLGPPPSPSPLQTLPADPQPGLAVPIVPPAPPRVIRIAPRTGHRFEIESVPGQNALLITGGIILNISGVDRFGILDVEADNLVIWASGDPQQFFQKLQSGQGEATRESEFYLSGNVVMRAGTGREERVLRADQLYYDVNRNVAVAISAVVEFRDKNLPEPLHFKADEVFQLGPNEFRAVRAEVFASRLPSDPGLKLVMGEARIRKRDVPKKNIFGQRILDVETGQYEEATEFYFQGENVRVKVGGVPVFFTGFVQGTLSNSTGPVRGVTMRRDRVFGWHFGAEFDVFNLLGIKPPGENQWSAGIDHFTRRGTGAGTQLDYTGLGILDLPGKYSGTVKAYGLHDQGADVLGPFRNGEPHPTWRGRVLWRHMHDLSPGWQIIAQASLLSDKNFLEQFYKPEFDEGPNQETFLYVNRRAGFWGASILAEPRLRSWVTETQWLPRGDGRVVGWSPFDLLSYYAHGSVGYARLRTTDQAPAPILPTDQTTNLLRFDLRQELAVPFNLGPFKFVPFGVIDAAAYSNDLLGNARGRFYAGGGARAALPVSRFYPEARSDLLNVEGIYHKMVFSGQYYIAGSSIAYNELPYLDRHNDDATDQALRGITPLQPGLNAAHGVALATSPKFNPQLYAIRRLNEFGADTLDSIQVFQLDWRQRFQTKRGFPGMQHTVDLLTLDLSMSLFPNPTRDNFGSTVGFLEYDAVWNVGDRTSVVSTGWVDPFADGARYFTVGMNLNRPDRTLLSLAYHHVNPINTRLLSASASYVFSQKYSATAAVSYDFGPNSGLWNSLTLTRSGADLQLAIGISYNPILNNFGFHVNLLPILVANQKPGGLFNNGSGIGRLH